MPRLPPGGLDHPKRFRFRALRQGILLALLTSGLAGCSPDAPVLDAPTPTTAPPLVLGAFEDDYGVRYAISDSVWQQQPDAIYRVVTWDADAQYLIAQNDANNPGEGGRWTRIDWMRLPDMAPYTWAYCLTAYDAASAEAAERTPAAQRETPRTGCNGFPFSRMKPVGGVSP